MLGTLALSIVASSLLPGGGDDPAVFVDYSQSRLPVRQSPHAVFPQRQTPRQARYLVLLALPPLSTRLLPSSVGFARDPGAP